jgi:hypothetical protein
MNVFNRVVMILLILALLVIITAALLFPYNSIDWLKWLGDQVAGRRGDLTVTWQLILIGIAVVADLILLFVLVLELRPSQPKAVRVQQVEGGQAAVTVDSIQNRLAFYIDSLDEVVSARPKVEIRGDRVRVAVDVRTAATVSVPAKAREVVGVIRMVITETMGLKLMGEPKVSIRTASFADVAAPPPLPTGRPVQPPTSEPIKPPPPEEPPAEERAVETPAEEGPVETPAEETPVEAPLEEKPAEAPAEEKAEAPGEEKPAEEAPSEEG